VAGLGEQPVVAIPPVAESRAIKIIPDAPPEASPARIPRPRGRPKLAKSETNFKTEE
jgi:hypothetical protein